MLVVCGFLALWLSAFTENEFWIGVIVWSVWGLLAIGLVAGILRRSRSGRRPERPQDPASFDPVQAAYQGRTTPTFPDSADSTSQIVDPPPPDPLVLPDDAKRLDRP
ncbi:hypothetical protein LK09_02930 [Microbacterium mangrovi]|uniref:Uncharacterized protein n=1 Tax=Microbacterium mangrovi TaxID=1348253 RepID=A0A0B2A903_9MICO|nr:hypothetical protein LK09_02930 [Microbacterium mangrovi]